MPINPTQVRCIFCGTGGLDFRVTPTQCRACGHIHPEYEGIKFLGSYNRADIPGLFEVSSKVSTPVDPVTLRSNAVKAEHELKAAFEKLEETGAATQKNEVLGSNEMGRAVRLREWAAFEMLATDIDFEGKLCLDNGAGLGVDTLRLIGRGADVVCIDFNPVSVRHGAAVVPEAQWFGGNAEFLPFADNVFDISVANAALHHMHDVEACVKEMLRVTKPDGHVLLISDPFMEHVESDTEREKLELNIFDRHPMVLNGINEGLIPFNRYIGSIQQEHDVKLLTMRIWGEKGQGNKPTYWSTDSDSISVLGSKRGNISSRVQVTDRHHPEGLKDDDEISTAAFLKTIGDPAASIAFLLPHLPQSAFDTFPFDKPSKFNLLNGWHGTQDYSSPWRTGYNRMRLYITDAFANGISGLNVKRSAEATIEETQVYVALNGHRLGQVTLAMDSEIMLNLDEIKARLGITFQEKNVVEIGIADENENRGAIWGTYSEDRVLSIKVVPRPRRSFWKALLAT